MTKAPTTTSTSYRAKNKRTQAQEIDVDLPSPSGSSYPSTADDHEGFRLEEAAYALPIPSVTGEVARNLLRSVLGVVSLEDAINVLHEITAERARPELAMQVLELRGERTKPTIQARSGPSISTAEAARRLDCSAQHVRNLVQRDELVGHEALGDSTRTVLPQWQFSGEKTVHTWVPDLIRSYGDNGWALMHFVTAPRADLGGGNYLHLFQTGRVDEALTAIRRSNPD